VNPTLTTAVVLYLGLVALVALAAAANAPVQAAARSGNVVGRVCVAVVVAVDLVSLLRGHRPVDLATHLGYAAAAVALPFILTWPGARTSYLLIALSAAVTAVVLVRLGQTWA